LLIVCECFAGLANELHAASWDPAAADYVGRKGKTIYVSKLGDNSDGSSWQKAFQTIQAALSAVPDDKGGHQILVRPDRYVEANLAPAFQGAAGSYNALIGDFDGSLGSGAKGWTLLDSSDPKKGFKSWDWWRHRQELGQWQQHRQDILLDRLRPLDIPQPLHRGRRRRAFLGFDKPKRRRIHRDLRRLHRHGPCIWRRLVLSGCTPERAERISSMLLPCLGLGGRHVRGVDGRIGKDYAQVSARHF
jgi:hypothetical protein